MRIREVGVQLALIFWFIVTMYLQHDLGLADNGDYTRSMAGISSGPLEIERNWPPPGTEDWSRRFFSYWIPFWKLELSLARPTSSAYLLWLPSAWLNHFLYAKQVLYLPILSLLPKLILFAVLLLLFKWIKQTSPLLLVSLGGPLTLLFTTTDYVAYLNSFYQETASLVFLALFLITLLFLKQRLCLTYLLCNLAALLFLTMAKPANLYWPLLAIPCVCAACSFQKKFRLRTLIIANFALICLFTSAAGFVTEAGTIPANRYHRLFYGILAFTPQPAVHLRALGIEDATPCINISAFTSIGKACLDQYQNQLSVPNTVSILYREPAIIIRMLTYALDNMQDISLEYLGKYAVDDPRSKTSPHITDGTEQRFWLATAETTPLNLWAALKFTFFPTGYSLAFVLIGFVLWFMLNLQRSGVYQALALVGLLFTLACAADMTVAIFGDGKYELIKHLFLANVLFDIAAIVFLNSVLVHGIEWLYLNQHEKWLHGGYFKQSCRVCHRVSTKEWGAPLGGHTASADLANREMKSGSW